MRRVSSAPFCNHHVVLYRIFKSHLTIGHISSADVVGDARTSERGSRHVCLAASAATLLENMTPLLRLFNILPKPKSGRKYPSRNITSLKETILLLMRPQSLRENWVFEQGGFLRRFSVTALLKTGFCSASVFYSPLCSTQRWPTIIDWQRRVSQSCSPGCLSNYRISAGFCLFRNHVLTRQPFLFPSLLVVSRHRGRLKNEFSCIFWKRTSCIR